MLTLVKSDSRMLVNFIFPISFGFKTHVTNGLHDRFMLLRLKYLEIMLGPTISSDICLFIFHLCGDARHRYRSLWRMDMFGTDFKRVGAPGRVPGLSGSVDHGEKTVSPKMEQLMFQPGTNMNSHRMRLSRFKHMMISLDTALKWCWLTVANKVFRPGLMVTFRTHELGETQTVHLGKLTPNTTSRCIVDICWYPVGYAT